MDITDELLSAVQCERGEVAMDADIAESTARRVMLHLYRGSIDLARAALEDSWSSHLAELSALTSDDPVSVVVRDQRTLRWLEKHGVKTISDLLNCNTQTVKSQTGGGPALVRQVLSLRDAARRRLKKLDVEEQGDDSSEEWTPRP